MDNPLAVGVEEAACNLADNDLDGVEGQLALPLQHIGKRKSLNVCHGDKQLVVLLTEVEHVHNVLVVEFLHCLGFQVEPLDSLLVGRCVQDLERDFTL